MNLKRLNINVNGVPAVGFVGSDELFNNVAARVGAPLPKGYIDFIKEVDGGRPEVGSLFLHGDTTGNSVTIDWFYTFSNPSLETVDAALDGWGRILDSMAMPIARDGGGNQFYLDLRDAVPSVWIYFHDENTVRIKLADSFEEFLAALTINPDFI